MLPSVSLDDNNDLPSSSNTALDLNSSNVAGCSVTDSHSQPSTPLLLQYHTSSSAGPSSTLRRRSYAYVDCGDPEYLCEFCGASFWSAERVSYVPRNRNPRYNQCCKVGRVRLRLPTDPPSSVKELFQQHEFLDNIRAYNSMFAMTSFGACVDDSINTGSAPYVFRVEGQVCHWIGTLCPPPDERPRFLQMYVYDTENELSNRLHFFGGNESSRVRVEIVQLLMSLLDALNALVRLFRSARELCDQPSVPDFSVTLFSSVNEHSYESPSPGTLGAIVLDSSPPAHEFDVVIHAKDGLPQRINKLHPLYMPLQYPLLFLYGESGWNPALRVTGDAMGDDKKLTMNMYYSFLIHDRPGVYSLLLKGGRLFQQFLVDAYICMEQGRLDYIRSNQNLFRTEFLQGVHDAVLRGDTEGRSIGKRVVLPASFTGGPRYMYKHYQDALAICRVHGNPQYFITFTCNVRWPEITRYFASRSPLKPQDRPDVVARIFRIKVKEMLDFLRIERPFGKVAADLYTIEFQKRGLPHCHMLLWVTEPFRIHESSQVDRYISAEIPDPISSPELHKIVADSMMHGPCGLARPYAPCMVNGSCSKRFPKACRSSTVFDKNGYVHYRRRLNSAFVDKGGILLDNSYVVPYNKDLCLRFRAHINVEYCGWNMVIKYLFKYISKGADRVRFTITKSDAHHAGGTSTSDATIDEVKNYVDGRFICPHEASWRILDFPIHHRNPAVQVLSVHLENMQNVSFKDNHHLQEIIDNAASKRTTLTEWLANNELDAGGMHLRYVDYLSEYRWDKNRKRWLRRVRDNNPTVGRLIYVHPTCGELFYLRLLLGCQFGCKSFADIRTVSGVTLSTYRAACESLGLLEDDSEWCQALEEAATWATASELRSLFTHMLLYYEISNPVSLWERQWHRMTDDVPRQLHITQNFSESHLSEEDLQQYVLYEVELLLNSNATPSSLADYGLPCPRPELLRILKNRLLMEERNYDREKLALEHERQKTCLHGKQLYVYENVISSVNNNRQILMFVYGHGGTGKTFLWTAIINALRSEGKIVLAVAASGIASLLMPSGRTAHSRFKIPLEMTEESICHVKKNSQLASLLIEASLIIWDEAPMNDRRCFEALDRTLRDIHDNNALPFGGKSLLLGGDFRQTLPVKRRATKEDIIASSLPRSYVWSKFRVATLTENMRLRHSRQNTSDVDETSAFASWLLDIGNGKSGTLDIHNPSDSRFIEIPSKFLIPHTDASLHNLIQFIYDNETLENPTPENLSEKAIVCPKNETADMVNMMILNMSSGDCSVYLSTDSIVPHSKNRGDLELLYPIEYLNELNFNGLPPHTLKLKIRTPVILLRNMNQSAGLCNGTRLIITQLLPRVIEAQVIIGTATGHKVYIPRIVLTHTDPELPFVFKRKQFPIKLCYAMTINKSQGQSLNKIGVYLPQPVFSHGQLYVAFSRSTSPNALKVYIESSDETPANVTKNIVYSDFLDEINHMQES